MVVSRYSIALVSALLLSDSLVKTKLFVFEFTFDREDTFPSNCFVLPLEVPPNVIMIRFHFLSSLTE